ncbi:MAG: hypothetical protein WB706_05865, partial [Nitrososphaeraceae archaeon]
ALALNKIKSNPDQFSLVLINYASQLNAPKGKFAKDKEKEKKAEQKYQNHNYFWLRFECS